VQVLLALGLTEFCMPIFVRASKLQADCKIWRSSSSDANANEAWNEVRALEIVDSGDACAVCLEEPMEDPLQLPVDTPFAGFASMIGECTVIMRGLRRICQR
jgi:hypothetical protein